MNDEEKNEIKNDNIDNIEINNSLESTKMNIKDKVNMRKDE